MTPNGPGKELYAQRRAALLERLEDAVLFVPATCEAVYSADVHYRYRQNSYIRYLSGFEEPAALILKDSSSDSGDDRGFSLFVRPRDQRSETWTGRRAGTEGAIEEYGADQAYPLDETFTHLQRCLGDARQLYVVYSQDTATNQRVVETIQTINTQRQRGNLGPLIVRDAGELLDEMRLLKSPAEIDLMRSACRISVEAHLRLMRELQPGMFEYQAEAVLEFAMRSGGCSGPAYGSIVAGGNNATVLHYTTNQAELREGELVLVDAGGEYGGYCADITRTLPIAATYSRAQAELYDIVFDARQAAIAEIKPGASVESVHQAAVKVLTQGLLDAGIIEGSLQECIDERRYNTYYMHQTSHWLGMDVHDVGRYRVDGQSRVLEDGMVLTVEPGLYVRADADVPDQYKGIGIRVEDDVAVTREGHEVLTAGLPSERAEIERIRSHTA